MKIDQTRPTTPVVTWPQMSAQLKVDHTERDLVMDYVDAATACAERALGTSLLTRTITATFYGYMPTMQWYDYRTGNKLYLPYGPVSSVTSITDANGTAVTDYSLERYGHSDCVVVHQGYTAPLTVVYVAGYGSDPTNVPADIRMAIRTHAATLWQSRESITDVEMVPVPHNLEMFYRLNKRTSPVA